MLAHVQAVGLGSSSGSGFRCRPVNGAPLPCEFGALGTSWHKVWQDHLMDTPATQMGSYRPRSFSKRVMGVVKTWFS